MGWINLIVQLAIFIPVMCYAGSVFKEIWPDLRDSYRESGKDS